MTEHSSVRPAAGTAASRFNFRIPTPEGPLLFNALSGAVLALQGSDGDTLAGVLTAPPSGDVDLTVLPESVVRDLHAGGFVVAQGSDELSVIRERYWQARHDTPIVLTLTTTMDCNLGCYYCYEERRNDALRSTDVEGIVALAADRLAGRDRLHVDWYGGEPLINVEFLESASLALQRYCQEHAVRYSASVISNGTRWPEDVSGFVARHAIRQVQISFDGLRENHDRRRRFRAGHGVDGTSSFDLAAALVDRLVKCVRVDVRFNIDRGNQGDLLPFLEASKSRGWFSGRFPATFQPARLSSYSERSAFLRNSELTLAEYDNLRAAAREAAADSFTVDESESPEGFPYPRTSVCAALAHDSAVVGADRRLYRCGLQVSEPHRAVGSLAEARGSTSLPVWGENDAQWWRAFDPTTQPRCSRCSFLPVCWGGCPKKHLERDVHALEEQGIYWRRNLARLVAQGVGRITTDGFEFREVDQFRTGSPPAPSTVSKVVDRNKPASSPFSRSSRRSHIGPAV